MNVYASFKAQGEVIMGCKRKRFKGKELDVA